MAATRTEVAIIGAGLAGTLCALSLSIHAPQYSPITVYESRPPQSPEIASGIILTPNGLHILSELTVYDRIKDICWTNEYRTYMNSLDEITRRVLVASETQYGYQNHRIYRRVFLNLVKEMCERHNVTIKYNQRYEGITSDTSSGVEFTINGTTHKAGLLIGADGIYSTVRKHIIPDIVPEYTGTTGVLAHIQWSNVTWPETFNQTIGRQCTIQGKPGAMFMMPETRDGSDVMVGMQLTYPAQTREKWEILSRDKDKLSDFFRRNYDAWHPTAQKLIDAVTSKPASDTLYLWPFLRIPKLDKWYSPTGRVLILGDAAHGMPPSSGQGLNQALEDVWTLTLLLQKLDLASPSSPTTTPSLVQMLEFWQTLRQSRLDAVWHWTTHATNVQRLPEAERIKLGERDGEVFYDDMSWLYDWRAEREVEAWFERLQKKEEDAGV